MMKTVACLLSIATATAVSLVLCAPSFADTPQTINLTIENHQKLVTVKDDSGKWLFAQVMTTPEVKVSQVALGTNMSRVILQDMKGKTLWSQTLTTSVWKVNAHGEWSDKFVACLTRATDSLGWKDSHTDPYANINRVENVVSSDDQLVTCRVSSKEHIFKIAPIKNGIALEVDNNKTVIILQPPAAPTVAQASVPSAPATSN